MRRDLLKKGYRLVRAAQVEGIPNLFGERVMRTTAGGVAAPPAGYTMSHALAVREGLSYRQDADRKVGFAAAADVTLTLGRQELIDEALLSALFARPTRRATLTVTVSSPATTTLTVDSTAGFPTSGSLYIGRERVTYTGTTGTSFTGCTRGVTGLAHYHTADTASVYRDCTDTPTYWTGRFVTVWVHVVSPEGRFLGTNWCTLGDYCWQEWRGVVASQPVPTSGGMELRCTSLVRYAGGSVGVAIKGPVAFDSAGVPLLYFTPSDQIAIVEIGGGLNASGGSLRSAIGTLADFCAIAQTNLRASAAPDNIFVRPKTTGAEFTIRPDGANPLVVTAVRVTARTWFLDEDPRDAPVIYGTGRCTVDLLPVTGTHGLSMLGWVVVELAPSADFSEVTVPGSGLVSIDVDGIIEVAAYDMTATGWSGRFTAFRLSRRAVGGVAVNPWSTGATVGIPAGLPNSALPATLLALWQSSGQATGPRGAYDTLAFGFGLGIPEAYMDAGSFAGFWFTPADMVVADEVDIAGSLGGHLSLRRRCVVQRISEAGEVKLTLVSIEVTDDPLALQMGKADLLLDGVEDVEQMESPNHIRIDTGYPGREGITHVVRDAARASAQGKVDWDLVAPGLSAREALEYGATLLLLSDGQQAVKLSLPPWSTLQIGDAVELTAAHPQLYSWVSAEWAPVSAMGRVLGVEPDAYDDTLRATVLLAGQYTAGLFLCPSAEVTSAPSSSILRVGKGAADRFQAGDGVAVYLPGSESTSYEEAGITSIDKTNASYDQINLNAALVVVTAAAGLVVTYPVYAVANTRQRRYLYVRSDRAWT